jgi:hypothetical protein
MFDFCPSIKSTGNRIYAVVMATGRCSQFGNDYKATAIGIEVESRKWTQSIVSGTHDLCCFHIGLMQFHPQILIQSSSVIRVLLS